ncbi:MAG: envelope integrity protein Cei [Actinomycetia bacterium]|nr:envelope integrity protein Cei [Actinomycetes bacterium]
MVAQITNSTAAFDKHGRPFRRRNFLPILVLFSSLAMATLLIWVIALSRPPDVREAAVCNPPPPPADSDSPGPQLGEQVSREEMIDVTPAALGNTEVRVLNASRQGGQAADVASALRDLGFTDLQADNDSIYDTVRLECQGQIRFGPAGRAAAAAVWLVAPCTELFQDERSDDSVDLALGTEFGGLSSSDDIDEVLVSLLPDATAPADPALLSKIHNGAC